MTHLTKFKNSFYIKKCAQHCLLFSLLIAVISACGVGSSDQATDPLVVENPVAFIQRPVPADNNNNLQTQDLRQPADFRPGARILIKSRASASAQPRDISSQAFADPAFLDDQGQLRYDVKDMTVSYEGKKLLFAMRAPEIPNADPEDQPKWNLWTYSVLNDELKRVMASDVIAEAGDDIAPAWLPDGRIVFASTRQRASKAVLLDEGKPQFAALDEDFRTAAFNLHVMNDDGSDIQQITFNQSHDLDPTVLSNGKILFSRWDNAGQTPNNGVNLYQVNPDGTGLSYVYGRHSHDAGDPGTNLQFVRPIEFTEGQLIAQFRAFAPGDLGALPIRIDIQNFSEANRALDGSSGVGQTALIAGLNASDEPSLNGRYRSVFPLFDGTNRFLVSWSPCRLQEIIPAATEPSPIVNCTQARLDSGLFAPAFPLYGLWVLDAGAGTQVPLQEPEEGQLVEDAVLMTARPLPAFIQDQVPLKDAAVLADAGLGILAIRSVYDFDGVDVTPAGLAAMANPAITPADARPARYLRIEKPVSIPDDDVLDFNNAAFGRSAAQSMREILGYVPIEPDGSVRVAVPANVALAVSLLDANGQRISQRHQNWLQVRPGETLACNGCHTQDSAVPHGRTGAEPTSVNTGAPTTGLPFPNSEPALFADMGETMAETFARINGTRRLTPDIVFVDEWTDPLVTPKAPSVNLAYSDLLTAPPITPVCATNWSALCRILINYETHIHPLWGLDRSLFDLDGITLLADNTCTNCHAPVDNMAAPMVPAAQLDLTDGPSDEVPLHFRAYHELLFNDNEQEILGGVLADRLVDTGEFQRDSNGDLILDGNGDPIPIFTTVNVNPSMSTAGAISSPNFMNRFQTGGTHAGFLSAAERKLIAEWLDLGAQYFNNPFDAPLN